MSVYVSPTANNYSGLDRGFNQRFRLEDGLSELRGEGIYLVSDAQDVLETLVAIKSFAPQSGDIRVISGGHCYENFVFQGARESGSGKRTRFVIDVSNMNSIHEETISGIEYVVIEPGASNWLIQQTLHSVYGSTLPGGSCYSVCAGGHIAGGGYGLLSRLHGLTVDYLEGVEMVIPDSSSDGFRIRDFQPEMDEDGLDWANRGGGAGHFGIITKYYFRKSKLPRAPERALFVSLPVPWAQFTGEQGSGAGGFAEFLQAYYDACNNLPGQAFTLGKFTLMQDESDTMSVALQVVYGKSSGHSAALSGGIDIPPLETKDDALAVINEFWLALESWISEPQRSSLCGKKYNIPGHPVSAAVSFDTIYDLPWIELTQMINGSGENQNGKYKSSHMIMNFSESEAEEIYAFLTGTQEENPVPDVLDKSQTLVQIDSYGLQVNSMDDPDSPNTAIAARNSVLKLQYQTYWKTLEGNASDAAIIEDNILKWLNEGYRQIHLKGTNGESGFPVWGEKYEGCYFNYPDRHLGVNTGYIGDSGNQYGDFLQLYFNDNVRDKLKVIKSIVDPDDLFSFAQSVSLE